MTSLRYFPNVVTLKLDKAKCVGCGMCETVCPHAVFQMEQKLAKIVTLQPSEVDIE